MQARFTIPGEPKGKARPRVTRTGHAYTPKDTVDYENTAKKIMRIACRGEFFEKGVPVFAKIQAYFGIPKSASKKNVERMRSGEIMPVKKSDLDNIAKIILDSANGVLYHDDAQIVSITICKFYSDIPRVNVCFSDEEIVG